MALPESLALVPDIEMGGVGGARVLWDSRPGFDAEWGMLCWKDRRFWFSKVCYEEELIWYSVSPLSEEQARILDDWYIQFRLLSHQWQILANDPVTARGLALKEKGRQVDAIAGARPSFEALPIVGRFSVSDHGNACDPKNEEKAQPG